MTLNEKDKQRLLLFLEDNELDYTPIDNGIIRFHLIAEDGMTFYVINNENEYLITKYNKDKDRPGSVPYENYQFKTLSEVLEQLKFYDSNLPKVYWEPTLESIQIGFDKDNHIEDWYEPFIKDDFYKVEEDNQYKYFSYTNEGYNPELISPFNTLHEVSAFNNLQLERIDKLYFEVHPISCVKNRESYLVKLLCNNDKIFKEYINYKVYKEKGLKLMLNTLFNDMEKYKL